MMSSQYPYILLYSIDPRSEHHEKSQSIVLPLLLGGRLYQGSLGLQGHPKQQTKKQVWFDITEEQKKKGAADVEVLWWRSFGRSQLLSYSHQVSECVFSSL